MSLEFFLQQMIGGIAIGMVYALIAIGYSMVYGILKFINFGHGAVYMFGTYVAYFIWLTLGKHMSNWPSFIIAMSLSIIITATFGMLMERIAYRPTRGKSRLTTFMSSVGMSLLVTYGMEFLVGPQPRPTPALFPGCYVQCWRRSGYRYADFHVHRGSCTADRYELSLSTKPGQANEFELVPKIWVLLI